MPLKKNEWKWWQGMLVGGIISILGFISFLMLLKSADNKIK
jgi:hypothetical protein